MRHNQGETLPGIEPAGPASRSNVSETVVEICAGAGGQALGLEKAGFEHKLAVELDHWPTQTLRSNRPDWDVRQGDVADRSVWNPSDFHGTDLLAGGVPCPPFSVAGKQLGTGDERDLFAWAVELAAEMRPRALMLENVRGLSLPRFAAYRQAVLDRLAELGYVADWRLVHASDFGLPQLRPRFILVALKPEDSAYFHWPVPTDCQATVGDTLRELMGENGWAHVHEWAEAANGVGPTIVGGSKKHGGADLGPTRARKAWSLLHVDGRGVADEAPSTSAPHFRAQPPRLTTTMVSRLQGWKAQDKWGFAGRKTAQYRQIGNAFPPPLAQRLGQSILHALRHTTSVSEGPTLVSVQDPIYRALRDSDHPLSVSDLVELVGASASARDIQRSLDHLSSDFEMDVVQLPEGPAYRLNGFRAFVGQATHDRHAAFTDPSSRSRVS